MPGPAGALANRFRRARTLVVANHLLLALEFALALGGAAGAAEAGAQGAPRADAADGRTSGAAAGTGRLLGAIDAAGGGAAGRSGVDAADGRASNAAAGTGRTLGVTDAAHSGTRGAPGMGATVGRSSDAAEGTDGRAVGADAADGGTLGTAAAPTFYSGFENPPAVAALTALGRALFRDPSLSASGKTSCASCHSPRHAFGPPNGLSVQRAGADGRRPGVRAVPSLRYLQNVPPFTEHYHDDDGDDSIDQGPAGGRTWDGRAQSAHDQARTPLLSPFEMANPSTLSVVAKVEHSRYSTQFQDAFGAGVFRDPALAFRGVLLALETYQQDAAEFYPYSSKYDAWLRQEAVLTVQESRGLAAFDDPARGNCARCHPSAVRAGAFPAFTDFGYAAIGAPRNAAIPANAERRYYDLGLCGPWRRDLTDRPEFCGLFRTPSLRNVALRRTFFHNGVLHRLPDVVRFYAERDTRPQNWFPRMADGVRQFDDVPKVYRSNLERAPPLDRQAGDAPPLNERDIADIAAFLNTLTDGYQVGKIDRGRSRDPSSP